MRVAPAALGLICCACLASALDVRQHSEVKPSHSVEPPRGLPDPNECVSLDDGNAVPLLGSPKAPVEAPASAEGAASCCPPANVVMPIRTRDDLGKELARKNFTGIGVEVGVQRGLFTRSLLGGWKGARLFVQVDLWAHQPNYADNANVKDTKHESFRQEACGYAKQLEQGKFVGQVVQCKNFSTACAKYFPDESLDFVYLDARHDRKGLLEDLHAYWPKVRPGGVIAGHDYTLQDEPGKGSDPEQTGQNWTVNYNGTVDATGRVAKGAIDDFFFGTDESPADLKRCPRQLTITYREGWWNTWMVGK